MATKKTTAKAASAKSSAKKPKTNETSVTTVTRIAASKPKASRLNVDLPDNLVNILIAELIGTFVLVLVALFPAAILAPVYVGLGLAAIVLMIGAVSGAHVNPAVTFGLWTMRKLPTILVPFYWAAQFLGAMAAMVVIGMLTQTPMQVNFGHFTAFSWAIFAIELIGTAIFMFGVSAIVSRPKLAMSGKAFGVGVALLAGILATSSLMPLVQNAAFKKYSESAQNQVMDVNDTEKKETPSLPRELHISGATLNPAVALAVNEKTESEARGSSTPQDNEVAHTRLGLEVIIGTLLGAALGGNLFLLVHYRAKIEE